MGQRWRWAAALAAIALAGQGAQAQAQAQGATTRQAAKTERADRAAAVADETGTLDGARRPAPADAAGAHKTPLAPSYGPVLDPRGRQGQDAVRKDPAEVHDETDTLTPQAPPAPERRQQQQQQQPQRPQARRHPAQQPAGAPAPRPLRPPRDTAAVQGLVPVPPPAPAPQPASPSSSAVVGCQGSFCTDAAGNSYSGSGPAVISSGGRLCTRGTSTVQCL